MTSNYSLSTWRICLKESDVHLAFDKIFLGGADGPLYHLFFGIEYNRLWNNCLLAHVMCLTFYFPSSGPELPDAVCRHGSEPGPVQPKRTERLRPEASLPPDHRVRI